MAKKDPGADGIYYEPPKADVFLALLIVSVVATSVASILMMMEAGIGK